MSRECAVLLLYCAVTVLYWTVTVCTGLMLYCTVLYWTLLYFTALYCIDYGRMTGLSAADGKFMLHVSCLNGHVEYLPRS